MTIKLTTTSSRYAVRHPDGYTFEVVTEYRIDDDGTHRGWSATATVRSRGLVTECAAIEAMIDPLRALLAELEENGP